LSSSQTSKEEEEEEEEEEEGEEGEEEEGVTARQTLWHRICKTGGTGFGQCTYSAAQAPI
jgi:hypothetical protein